MLGDALRFLGRLLRREVSLLLEARRGALLLLPFPLRLLLSLLRLFFRLAPRLLLALLSLLALLLSLLERLLCDAVSLPPLPLQRALGGPSRRAAGTEVLGLLPRR